MSIYTVLLVVDGGRGRVSFGIICMHESFDFSYNMHIAMHTALHARYTIDGPWPRDGDAHASAIRAAV